MSAADARDAAALRKGSAVLAAGVTGFGVMAAELTGVRLLAPHFGDSAYVWTNVIGVILAAMAIGATLGGRLSARANARAWPLRLLLAAAVLLVVAPFATGWLGPALLPADLPLDAAMPALIRGSLAASALVFAPPLLLLAAVSPLLIVLVAKGGVALGRAAGDVAAAGTVGSLVGTFAATHWLVPGIGCRLSLCLAAAALLVAAALVAPRRRAATAGGLLILPLAASLLHGGPLRAVGDGVELLAERETPYQFLQVQREQLAAEPARTVLRINEGLDSFHSLQIEDSAFTGGAYYDWHAIGPWLVDCDATPRALSIGDAAGTLRQVYSAVHPGVFVDAVDIDAETMRLGDEFFTRPKAAGGRYALDGRVFVERSDERWHVIHVDAYAHQVYVPAHLASVEFFRAAYARLEAGGVLCCNVGALEVDDPVLRCIALTVREVFGAAHVLKIPQSRNALLCARRELPFALDQLRGAVAPDTLGPQDAAHLRTILQHCADPANWHEPRLPERVAVAAAGDVVLTDDRPLLDELLLASYVRTDDVRAAVTCAGPRGLADAETSAYQALQRGDWRGVLHAVEQSATDSPYLRQLAGDARWYLRQLHAAVAEYEQGLSIVGDDAERAASLRGRLEEAERELAPTERAELAAARNASIAALACALLALCAVVVRRL